MLKYLGSFLDKLMVRLKWLISYIILFPFLIFLWIFVGLMFISVPFIILIKPDILKNNEKSN